MDLMELSEQEKEAAYARFLSMRETLPEAPEYDAAPRFTPGVVLIVDGKYREMNTHALDHLSDFEPAIDWLLSFMPARHRTQYWMDRIQNGVCLMTSFADSPGYMPKAVGILNLERNDEGRPIVAAYTMTLEEIDMTDLGKMCEAIALATDADLVHLWTPRPVPVVAGYNTTRCWFGQLQTAPMKPKH